MEFTAEEILDMFHMDEIENDEVYCLTGEELLKLIKQA
jgi:hypothetical protein